MKTKIVFTEENKLLFGLEKDVVYEALINGAKAPQILTIMEEDDFIESEHYQLVKKCADGFVNGSAYDLTLAFSDFNQTTKELMVRFSNRTHLGLGFVPIGTYCRQLKGAAINRQVSIIYNSPGSEPEKVNEVRALLEKKHIAEERSPKDIAAIRERFEKSINDGLTFNPTGVMTLSKNYVDYVPGHLWVIGGRSSVGKTSFLVELIARAEGLNMILLSTEMTENQMYARLLAQDSGIHSQKIVRGSRLTEDQLDRFNRAKETVEKYKIELVNDTFELSSLEAMISKKHEQGKVDIVFIDYIQQLHVTGAKSEYEKHATLAARIYQLAQRLGITIVCFSQVSNVVARGETDNLEVKGAGDWIAAADLGIRLKRPSEGDGINQLTIDVAKNRHGSTFSFIMEFTDNWTRLKE